HRRRYPSDRLPGVDYEVRGKSFARNGMGLTRRKGRWTMRSTREPYCAISATKISGCAKVCEVWPLGNLARLLTFWLVMKGHSCAILDPGGVGHSAHARRL